MVVIGMVALVPQSNVMMPPLATAAASRVWLHVPAPVPTTLVGWLVSGGLTGGVQTGPGGGGTEPSPPAPSMATGPSVGPPLSEVLAPSDVLPPSIVLPLSAVLPPSLPPAGIAWPPPPQATTSIRTMACEQRITGPRRSVPGTGRRTSTEVLSIPA